jgi:hypothetical protein
MSLAPAHSSVGRSGVPVSGGALLGAVRRSHASQAHTTSGQGLPCADHGPGEVCDAPHALLQAGEGTCHAAQQLALQTTAGFRWRKLQWSVRWVHSAMPR